MADKLTQFIQIAYQHLGQNGEWAWTTEPSWGKGWAWCAAYVRKCAETVGGLDNVIFKCYNNCEYFASASDNGGYGGQYFVGHIVPQVGDLIFFRWHSSTKAFTNKYVSDHIGIVVEVYSDAVYTIEGNTMSGGRGAMYSIATKKSYNINNDEIWSYYRPNWAKVGASVQAQYGNFQNKRSEVGGVTAVLSTSPDGHYTTEIQTHVNALHGVSASGGVSSYAVAQISTPIQTTQVGSAEQLVYTEPNGSEDALVREVSYFGYNYKPSLSKTPNKLSIINLTLYNNVSPSLNSSNKVVSNVSANTITTSQGVANASGSAQSSTISYQCNLSNLHTNASTIMNLLMNRGFNCASSVGILANIYQESGYNPSAIGDNGTSFGLCQWHNMPKYNFYLGEEMKTYVNSTGQWDKNISGQIDFLIYTLTNATMAQRCSCTGLYEILMKEPNNLQGVLDATDKFLRMYEKPSNIDAESKLRQGYAKDIWSKLGNQLVK